MPLWLPPSSMCVLLSSSSFTLSCPRRARSETKIDGELSLHRAVKEGCTLLIRQPMAQRFLHRMWRGPLLDILYNREDERAAPLRARGFLMLRAGVLLALQLFLLLVVPGARFNGPRAPSGHVPSYSDNGFVAFLITLGVIMWACAAGALSPTLIYDELMPMMSLLNGTALAASVLLYVKGLCCPSTADAGSSGSALMDLYWGTELYPRLFGGRIDLKQLLIARCVTR